MALNPETLPSEVTTESLYVDTFTANTNLAGVDISQYIGKLKVTLNAGVGANNNQSVIASLQTGAESAANFAAFDPAIAFTNIAVNGAATSQSLVVDTRVAGKYLRAAVGESADGNGRAVSITLTGKKQVTA